MVALEGCLGEHSLAPKSDAGSHRKSARHSYDKGKGKGAIDMVSAWASENQLVVGQVKVADKPNEITAIPKLLNILDVSGCIVTIDATGAQKEIAKQIID